VKTSSIFQPIFLCLIFLLLLLLLFFFFFFFFFAFVFVLFGFWSPDVCLSSTAATRSRRRKR